MAQPVWTLSVDLQTKTATFQSGLSDAAKAARSSFQDIKSEAADMGAATGYSMMEARHSVMLLGDEFGVRLPRALSTFIAGLGPIGPALQAAFPFLAIIAGATLLLEHLGKLRQEGDKLTGSQLTFGTTVANVLNDLDDRLLKAGIRTDELNHDHFGALEKQLQLIDHQTFNELSRTFETLAKAAEASFADLKASSLETFFQISKGAEGPKHALEEFKASYESLLAQHKDKEASDLLSGTLESAKKAYELMQAQQGGHGSDEKELAAQAKLVQVLQAQIDAKEKLAALKDSDVTNATQKAQDNAGSDSDAAARQQAQQARQEAEETERLWQENYRRVVADLQESERQKIDATKQGSAARLAAIDAAIKEEESKGLQETGFFRSLLQDRVNTQRQMDDELSKLNAEAGKEAAEHDLAMSQLRIAAERESTEQWLNVTKQSAQTRLQAAQHFEQEEYEAQQSALQRELAALDTHSAEYANKQQAFYDKLEQLEKQHANKMQQLQEQADQKELADVRRSEQEVEQEYARGFSQVIMGKESFAKMMQQADSQILGSMMQHAIMSAMTLDFGKEKEAAAAARKAYLAGMDLPFPANLVAAPALAAGAFASVMAFEEGGRVPGTGIGDTVPAMLTPGETVLSKDLTDHLTDMARSGDGGGTHNHFHIAVNHAPVINAMDSDGMERALKKNADVLSRHLHNELRRMNR